MAYVVLNPVRAKMASTPEDSGHTSIRKRTLAVKHKRLQPNSLMPFVGNPRHPMPKGIAFSLQDYCELVDTTGRCIREDKAGHIEHQHSPILSRLGLDAEQWLCLTTEFEKYFCYAAGAEQMMNSFKLHTNHQRMRGMVRQNYYFQQGDLKVIGEPLTLFKLVYYNNIDPFQYSKKKGQVACFTILLFNPSTRFLRGCT